MREAEVRKEADMKLSHEMQVREVYSLCNVPYYFNRESINTYCPG